MKKIITYSIVFSLFATGCKDVLEKLPLDKPAQETFYNTASEIQNGVNACYDNLRESETNMYNFPMSLDLMSDTGFPRQESRFKTIAKGEHSSDIDLFLTVWKRAYNGINRCNNMLQVIEKKAELLSNEKFDLLKGQLLFLRGFYYTRLVLYFGGVPLLLKPVTTLAEAREVIRTPKDEVIAQLMEDYNNAEILLPLSYSQKEDIGRATRGTVNAYKARAALYFGKYDVAAESAKKVIDSKQYELYPKYGELFVSKGLRDPANKELIFVDDFSPEIPTFTELTLHNSSRNTGGWSTSVPTQNLVDSYHCIDDKNIAESPLFKKGKPFENRDPRLKLSIVVPGDRYGDFRYETHSDSLTCYQYSTGKMVRNNDSYSVNQFTSFTGYITRKYADESYVNKNTKCDYPIILYRYAELLLNYAEAKIELNQIDQTVVDALNLIRQGRTDVKMPTFTLSSLGSQEQARIKVRHERKIELAFEGFRYTDLRRWNLAEKYANVPVLGRPFKGGYNEWPTVNFDENGEPVYAVDLYKPHPSTDYRIVETRLFVKGKHELWPIPLTERNLNSKLTQNPNY